MRKAKFSLDLLLVMGLVLAVAGAATAGPPPDVWKNTYTWTLVESPGALGVWPNEANSPNIFEADEGLLGRIVTHWTSDSVNGNNPAMPCTGVGTPFACCEGFQLDAVAPFCDDIPNLDTGIGIAEIGNSCQLAQSYPCQPSNYTCTAVGAPDACCTGAGTGTCTGPPLFLFATAGAVPAVHEGPIGSANVAVASECNKHTNACGPVPLAPGTHLVPSAEHAVAAGEYSYFVGHKTPTGKGIGFFTGNYTYRQASPDCNGCAPTGRGRDKNNQTALSYTIPDSQVQTSAINIWNTQATAFGTHGLKNLINPGTDAGQMSLCGNGIAYQDITSNICSDGVAGAPNYTIPDQKVSFWTYSVNMANHANLTNPAKCNPPDCYVQRVIIPAALAQAAAYPAGCVGAGNPNPCCTGVGTGTCGPARNIQVLKARTVMPAGAPAGLGNATVDSILFAYTTQLLDLDGDGVEDRSDPCPQDPTDFCIADLVIGGNCPAGQVFCADSNGDLGCLDAFLCDYKLDVNNDCFADGNDESVLKGSGNGISGLEAFGSGLFIGPFNP